MAYIYRIKNKITKKSYIGESKKKDVKWRWSEHKQNIKNLKDNTKTNGREFIWKYA
jgi:hypothetical protein